MKLKYIREHLIKHILNSFGLDGGNKKIFGGNPCGPVYASNGVVDLIDEMDFDKLSEYAMFKAKLNSHPIQYKEPVQRVWGR